MKENLEFIFSNINDWLKFAEAKHSGLLALAIGMLFISGKIIKQPKKVFWRIIFIIPAILLAIAVYISLSSFEPTLKKEKSKVVVTSDNNAYYFGNISLMDRISFQQLLTRDSVHMFSSLENQLIDQIIINAGITTKKMTSFKYALFFFKISLLLLLGLFISKYIAERMTPKDQES